MGYLGFLGIWVLVTIALLKGNLMIAAAVSAFFCALLLWFYVKRQSRMRFGAANLKVITRTSRSLLAGDGYARSHAVASRSLRV